VFRGNGHRGLVAVALSICVHCTAQIGRATKECAAELAHYDKILFVELTVPLQRWWQRDKSKLGRACRSIYLRSWLAHFMTSIPLKMGAGWPQSSSVCSRGATSPAMKHVHLEWKAPCIWKVALHWTGLPACKLLLWMDATNSDYNNKAFLSFSAICTWPGMTHSQYL